MCGRNTQAAFYMQVANRRLVIVRPQDGRNSISEFLKKLFKKLIKIKFKLFFLNNKMADHESVIVYCIKSVGGLFFELA